jgi:hypothetical protein
MTGLTFEDGIVRLGDQEAPGILKALSVRGQVKYDDTKMDGKSGQAKIPAGWDDADITVTLDLLTDETGTCYQKLKVLNAIFTGADPEQDTEHKQTVKHSPKIYTVVNQHINARGVKRVYFSGLASSETDEDDVIQAVLTFTEKGGVAAKAETRAQGTSKSSGASGNSVSDDDETQIKGRL